MSNRRMHREELKAVRQSGTNGVYVDPATGKIVARKIKTPSDLPSPPEPTLQQLKEAGKYVSDKPKSVPKSAKAKSFPSYAHEQHETVEQVKDLPEVTKFETALSDFQKTLGESREYFEGLETPTQIYATKTIKPFASVDKAVRNLIDYSRKQFTLGNYPSDEEYKEWLQTASPSELLGPTPFAPKTTDEALARINFAATQGLVGAYKEAIFPFSYGTYKPENVYEASAQIAGALLTPTPQDYIIGKALSKVVGKVDDFVSAINEYRLTKKLGKGWELIPDELGDTWIRIGEGYGVDIPEQAIKDLLRAHKTGQYVPTSKMDEWVAKHIYSAGAGYYPFPELVNVPREGFTDPGLLAELTRLRNLFKVSPEVVREGFIGGLGSIPLAIDLLNQEKEKVGRSGRTTEYIERRIRSLNRGIATLKNLEDTIAETTEITPIIDKITMESMPIEEEGILPFEITEPLPIEITRPEVVPTVEQTPLTEPVVEPIVKPMQTTTTIPSIPITQLEEFPSPLVSKPSFQLKRPKQKHGVTEFEHVERFMVSFRYGFRGEEFNVEASDPLEAARKGESARRIQQDPTEFRVVRIGSIVET